jgi:small subunit ribosomal protein S16
LIEIDEDRALHWLRVGAQPSNQVRNLMVKTGIWDRFVQERPSAAALVPQKGERVEKPKVSKKAAAKAAEAAVTDAPAPEAAEPVVVDEPTGDEGTPEPAPSSTQE